MIDQRPPGYLLDLTLNARGNRKSAARPSFRALHGNVPAIWEIGVRPL
jgi:hypothetical protein